MLQQLRGFIQERFTFVDGDQARAFHHQPSQRNGAEAVRQRQPIELQGVMIDRTPIQDDENVLASPSLQGFADERPIEIDHPDEFVGQPPAHLGNAPGGLRLTRNVLGDLAQMHRLGQNQADNHPDPIGDPFQVGLRMNLAQLRKHSGVQFLATAHEAGLSVWYGNHRLCQFHEHSTNC